MYSFVALLVAGWFAVAGVRDMDDLPIQRDSTISDRTAADVVEEQDRQLKTTVLVALVPVVVAFSFIVFVFYRARRESFFKQKEAELKFRMSELEMNALRAQINPHFIFNCLNSIHHYMHRHDVKQAGEYLIKFSQLIRYVLETSTSQMVTLTDDLDVLKIYMELEQLRMHHAFDFTIDTSRVPEANVIRIPPMMLQPFVENSIWHGLNHKGNGGHIAVGAHLEGEVVQFRIEDNGKRQTKVDETYISPTIKKTSMGMSLIKDRLDVVSRKYNVPAKFAIEDRMKDASPCEGTRVILDLPFEN